MLFTLGGVSLLLAGSAKAHFRLLYPEVRGDFVSDKNLDFCGGYTNPGPRTVFPLENGFFKINTGHPDWTGGVIVSTEQNVTSFDDFAGPDDEHVWIRPPALSPEAGERCIPLNMSAYDIDGIVDGANVTIQIVLTGSDGDLFQCADLTLSSEFTLDDIPCTNTTADGDHHGTGDGDHDGDHEGEGEGEGEGQEGAAVASFRGTWATLGAAFAGGFAALLL